MARRPDAAWHRFTAKERDVFVAAIVVAVVGLVLVFIGIEVGASLLGLAAVTMSLLAFRANMRQ